MSTEAALLAAIHADPRWSTVEEMFGTVRENIAVLAQARLPALRRVRGNVPFESEHLEALAKRTTPLSIDRLEVAHAGQRLPRVVHVVPRAEVMAYADRPREALGFLAPLGVVRARLRVHDLRAASQQLVGWDAQFERVALQRLHPYRDELVLDGTSGTYRLMT